MKIIGLTGGIGSGKSIISNILLKKGIPVYSSDKRAKFVMLHDSKLKKKLITTFGNEFVTTDQLIYFIKDIYEVCKKNNLKLILKSKKVISEKLNKNYIRSILFSSTLNNQKINSIIHPYVYKDFDKWKKQQKSKFVIYESALIFETGSYKKNDLNILVTCDEFERVKRVMLRDKCSEDVVRKKMKFQWKDEMKINLSDYVVHNNELDKLEEEAISLISFLMKGFR